MARKSDDIHAAHEGTQRVEWSGLWDDLVKVVVSANRKLQARRRADEALSATSGGAVDGATRLA